MSTPRKSFDELLEGRHQRRLKHEDRVIARADRPHDAAEKFIGELVREGRTVYYICPPGGKYREGSRVELIQFLIRNRYV